MPNEYFDWPARAASDRFVRFDVVRSADMNDALDDLSNGLAKLPTPAQLWSQRQNYAVATGAANAWSASIAATYLTALVDGMQVRVKFGASNTTTTPTLNLNGLGAKRIVAYNTADIEAGFIEAGIVETLVYNATTDRWHLMKSPDSAAASGVSYNGGTVQDALDDLGAATDAIRLADYAAVRAYDGGEKTIAVTGYMVTTAPAGISGMFVRDDTDNTSTDDGGTILVDANGKRWKRSYDGPINALWYGSPVDGTSHPLSDYFATLAEAQAVFPHVTALTDEYDWVAAQAAVNFAGAINGTTVLLPVRYSTSSWRFNQPLKVPDGVILDGLGYSYPTGDGEHIVSTAAAGIVTKNGYDDTDNSQSVALRNLKIKMLTAAAEGVVLAAAKRCITDNVVVVLQAANQVGVRMLAEKGARSFGGNFYNKIDAHVINNGGGAGCIAVKLTGIANDGQNNANDFWIHQEACDKGILVGPALSNNFWGPSLEDNTTCAIQFQADAVRNTVWGAHVEGVGGTVVAVFDVGSSGNRMFVESYTTAMTIMTDAGSNNELVYDNLIYSSGSTKHKRFRRPTDTQDVLVVGPNGVYHGDGSTADPTTADSVGRRWSRLNWTTYTHTLNTAGPTVTPDCNNGYDNYINAQGSTSGTITINAPINSFSDTEVVSFEIINNTANPLTLAWNANYIKNSVLPTSLTAGQRYTAEFKRRGTSWVKRSLGPA